VLLLMIDANFIKHALRKRYAPPEYCIAFEVGDGIGGNGFMNTHRHLDAISMNLYPSRGYTLYGFEVKIDRQDLKREIATPDKADAVGKFLDAFYVVYPENLNILDLEIPYGWGLMSCDENYRLKKVKESEKITPVDVTRTFLAALFRAMGVEDQYRVDKLADEKVKNLTKSLEDSFASRVRHARDIQRSENEERIRWADSVIKGVLDAGFEWENLRWSDPTFVRAIKAALAYDSISIQKVERVCQMLVNLSDAIRKEMSDIKVKPEETEVVI
jgi:hypothetical protein